MRRTRDAGRWRGGLLTGLAAAGLAAGGCAGFRDEITARDFSVKNLFAKPDPLLVLRDSSDGHQRAQALRSLREPKQHGGTDQEQELVVKVLTTAVVSERQALCRLAAVGSLSGFQDPRAVPALVEAYYKADNFAVETATVIRCQAVTALGTTGNPAAVEHLVKVVREPPTEGTEEEKRQALDVRVAAARALGNFNQPQAAEALVSVLRAEKDVALRVRANESLTAMTGKQLPPDAKAWQEELRLPPGDATAAQPGRPTVQRAGWSGNN